LNELRKLVDFGSKLSSDLGKTLDEEAVNAIDRAYEFSSNLVYLEDVPVGFINFWSISLDSGNKNRNNISEDLKNNLSAVTYIEHFAIDPSFRNGQLGSSVLNYFLTTYCPNIKSKSREEYPEPKLVVLEVERPINPSSDELSARRIRFYERLGFSLLNFDYHQPPYHSGNEFIPMHLMSFGTPPNNATFSIIKSHIYKYVYGLTI
jgi:ribosomal protein S18 acetylase RimI-like enzyme